MEEDEFLPPTLPELPIDLGKYLPETKRFFALFQCPVCYEPLRNPVMTLNCSHNFCSLCVRKYLLYKKQCPSCFLSLHDSDLKPNRILSDCIEIFAQILPKLADLTRGKKPEKSQEEAKIQFINAEPSTSKEVAKR